MDKANQLFRAFSDETRLRILNLLAQDEQCVRGCFQEIEVLKQDLARRATLQSPRRCSEGES
jgi:DNA-binding transcriptional ArsR family regulator